MKWFSTGTTEPSEDTMILYNDQPQYLNHWQGTIFCYTLAPSCRGHAAQTPLQINHTPHGTGTPSWHQSLSRTRQLRNSQRYMTKSWPQSSPDTCLIYLMYLKKWPSMECCWLEGLCLDGNNVWMGSIGQRTVTWLPGPLHFPLQCSVTVAMIVIYTICQWL